MKAIITACLILLSTLPIMAQQTQASKSENLTIGVIVPEQDDEIDYKAFKLLQTKMENLMLANGISSMMNGGFVMYPVVNIMQTDVVEGGMKNITIVNVDVSLYISQLSTGMTFGNITQSLKGSGENTPAAVRNAFSKLSPSNKEIATFIAQGKQKIMDYYKTNQKTIISRANSLAAAGQYEEALAWLMTYPESLSGYNEVLAASVVIYKQYQNASCSQFIQQAKGALAMKDYQQAIECLNGIDATSKCGKEVVTLMAQLKAAIQKEDADARRMYEKEMNAAVSLESQRINAVKEVAKAYYSNQPVIHYTQVIR